MSTVISNNIDSYNSENARTRDNKGFVDIHCHCLPGLDDGPTTIASAISLCRILAQEDIAIVAATPHQLGRYEYCNESEIIREAVDNLNEVLYEQNIPLNIVPGSEVRVDERISRFLQDDKILTMADGGKYILLELPHHILIDIEPLLKELNSMGVKSIISHVERHTSLTKQRSILQRWLEYSTTLQVTASSLIGLSGMEAKKTAWYYLKSGLAGIVATDSHDTDKRRPYMKAAFQLIRNILGEDVAHSVCVENPFRIINNQDISSASVFFHQEVLR